MQGVKMDPFKPWRSAFAVWRVMAEAQVVMSLRVLGMMGVLPASPRENRTMAAEKGPAFARVAVAAGAAALAGKGPDGIAEAAVRPVRRRTSANVKRLTKPRRKPAT